MSENFLRNQAKKLTRKRGERSNLIRKLFPNATKNEVKSLSSQIGQFARGERDLTPNVEKFFDSLISGKKQKLKRRTKPVTSKKLLPKEIQKARVAQGKKAHKYKRSSKLKRYEAKFTCDTNSKKKLKHNFGFVLDKRSKSAESRAKNLHSDIYPDHTVLDFEVRKK